MNIIEQTTKKITPDKRFRIKLHSDDCYLLYLDKDRGDIDLQRHFILARDSNLKIIIVCLAGNKINLSVDCDLAGQGSSLELSALVYGNKDQQFNLILNVNHQVPETKSVVKIRQALDDQAQGSVKSKIKIMPQAQGSEASLEEKTYLLSDQVQNHSIPSLEIEANEVKAGHSSSQSRLQQDDLAYLQSRGLATKEAKALLLDGFLATVYEDINDTKIKTEIKKLIATKVNEQ